MGTPTYEQVAYRFRNDDGSETAATWPVALNTDITQNPTDGYSKRLRAILENNNATRGTSVVVAWEYSFNTGAWTPITAVSSYIRGYNSSFVVDGIDCTEQLGTGTFLAANGGYTEDGVLAAIGTWAKSERIETELSYYLVDADLAPTNTIDIRLVNTYVITYTNAPQIVVTHPRRIAIGHT